MVQLSENYTNQHQKAQEFFRRRRDIGNQSSNTEDFPNKTNEELSLQAELIDSETVDKYLQEGKISGVSSEAVEQLWENLHSIRNVINRFPSFKRFFILQTIDFFNTPSHIDKVLPALLNLNQAKHKQEILDFVFSTFSTLNRNIETIISIPDLFSQESLHIERGGLYTLSSDIAKSIGKLFAPAYVAGFKENTSDVGRVLEIFKSYKVGNGSSVSSPLIEHMCTPEAELRKAVLEFIAHIQTHGLLQLYAQKRYQFYKRFLKQILKNKKLGILDSYNSSVVLAGCLASNPQLAPDPSLLENMSSTDHYEDPVTRDAYRDFIEDLTPITVIDLVGDYKLSIRLIADGQSESDEPGDYQSKPSSWLSLKQLKNKLIRTPKS